MFTFVLPIHVFKTNDSLTLLFFNQIDYDPWIPGQCLPCGELYPAVFT